MCMDELLDILDLVVDTGLEGAVTWIFRILGVIAILAGIGLWLFTDLGLLVPGILVVGGIVLVAIPGILVELTELAG